MAQNELPLFFIKDMNQSKINLHSIIQNQCKQHQPKTNLHSIIQKRCRQHQPNTNAHNTTLFSVGFSNLKTFTLRSMPLTCYSARSRR